MRWKTSMIPTWPSLSLVEAAPGVEVPRLVARLVTGPEISHNAIYVKNVPYGTGAEPDTTEVSRLMSKCCVARSSGGQNRSTTGTAMNDYMIYELANQRHADIIDQVRRSRTITSRGYRGSWTRVTTSARQRFAVVAHGLTNRTRVPAAG
jgi:hypothetical protein